MLLTLWNHVYPRSLLSDAQKKAHLLSCFCLIFLVSAGIAADQLTKELSSRNLLTWTDPSNIRNYRAKFYPVWHYGDIETARTKGPYLSLRLSYVRNPGAAWGSLANLDDRIRVPLFHVVTLLCVLFIIFYLRITPLSHRLGRWSLALIFSGAVGNLIDRVRLHYVIDWIDVRWNIGGWYYAFPNFNIADMLISVGAFFFLLYLFLDPKRRKKLSEEEAESHFIEAEEEEQNPP